MSGLFYPACGGRAARGARRAGSSRSHPARRACPVQYPSSRGQTNCPAAGERSIRPTRGLSERYREQLGAAIGRTADESASEALFKTKVVVFTKDRPGMLLTVSTAVTANTVNIIDVHSKTREVGGESAFQYAVHISSLEQLDGLMIALDKLDDVVKVIRGDMEDMLHDSPAAFWENALRGS